MMVRSWIHSMGVVLAMALAFTLAACGPQDGARTGADAGDTAAGADQQVVFGTGFYKEEDTGQAVIRWVRQEATMRVRAPEAGRYRLQLRPITVFVKDENTIDVQVNGTSAGSVRTSTSEFGNAPGESVEVWLNAGENEVRLRSDQQERALPNDDRTPAFGLVLPVGVERIP